MDDPYRYDLSGLPNVVLIGITVHRCPSCGGQSPIIPRLDELHRTIAEGLINKTASLTGPEVRFLRKKAGYAAKDFAKLLRVDPTFL